MAKNRTNSLVIVANSCINHSREKLIRAKELVRMYMDWQNMLRQWLKKSDLSETKKRCYEHRIHKNKKAINGLSQYVSDLRYDMKLAQRMHPLNNKKKNDTSKKQSI